MLTVHQVSEYTGLSIRTLQYYDKIGLLHAAEYTEAGYRLYDDSSLESLQQIMLFRELEFPLQEQEGPQRPCGVMEGIACGRSRGREFPCVLRELNHLQEGQCRASMQVG